MGSKARLGAGDMETLVSSRLLMKQVKRLRFCFAALLLRRPRLAITALRYVQDRLLSVRVLPCAVCRVPFSVDHSSGW